MQLSTGEPLLRLSRQRDFVTALWHSFAMMHQLPFFYEVGTRQQPVKTKMSHRRPWGAWKRQARRVNMTSSSLSMSSTGAAAAMGQVHVSEACPRQYSEAAAVWALSSSLVDLTVPTVLCCGHRRKGRRLVGPPSPWQGPATVSRSLAKSMLPHTRRLQAQLEERHALHAPQARNLLLRVRTFRAASRVLRGHES